MPLFSGENRRYLDGISESRQRILPPPSGSLPPSSSEESSAARRAGLPPAASLGDGSSGPAIAAFPLRRYRRRRFALLLRQSHQLRGKASPFSLRLFLRRAWNSGVVIALFSIFTRSAGNSCGCCPCRLSGAPSSLDPRRIAPYAKLSLLSSLLLNIIMFDVWAVAM